MNILLDPLPYSVSVDGVEYPILTDFKDWILFEIMLLDKDVGRDAVIYASEWYVDTVPATDPLHPLHKFYAGGNRVRQKKKKTRSKQGYKNDSPALTILMWTQG